MFIFKFNIINYFQGGNIPSKNNFTSALPLMLVTSVTSARIPLWDFLVKFYSALIWPSPN